MQSIVLNEFDSGVLLGLNIGILLGLSIILIGRFLDKYSVVIRKKEAK